MYLPWVLSRSLAWEKSDTPRPAAPNKALVPTASSGRSSHTPAAGGGSLRALDTCGVDQNYPIVQLRWLVAVYFFVGPQKSKGQSTRPSHQF